MSPSQKAPVQLSLFQFEPRHDFINKQNNKVKTNQNKNKTRPKTKKSTHGVGENKRKKSANKRKTPKKLQSLTYSLNYYNWHNY